MKKLLLIFHEQPDATSEISFKNVSASSYIQAQDFELLNICVSSIAKYLDHDSLIRKMNSILKNNQIIAAVFSRCFSEESDRIFELFKLNDCKTVCFWDDDLIGIPKELGKNVYDFFNRPRTLKILKNIAFNSDLFLSSTENLDNKVKHVYGIRNVRHLNIYRSVSELAQPELSDRVVFGYMGSQSHSQDLARYVDLIESVLLKESNATFEVFGTIEIPEKLKKYEGDRVFKIDKTADYKSFLKKLRSLKWKVGLAALCDNEFNSFKANTKWVEYTEAGFVTLASNVDTYRDLINANAAVDLDILTADDFISFLNSDLKRSQVYRNACNYCMGNFHIEEHAKNLIKLLCE